MTNLLPCPFCGGAAEELIDHTLEQDHSVWCRECGFNISRFFHLDHISAWNRRALPAASQPETEIEECINELGPWLTEPKTKQPEAEPVAQASLEVENLIALIGQYGLFMGEAWRVGEGAEIMDAYQAAYEEFTTPAPVVPAESDVLVARLSVMASQPGLSSDIANTLSDAAVAIRAQQPAAPVSGVTVQEAGWQPIETAPHEELVVLGWHEDGVWKQEIALASAGKRLPNGYSNRWLHGRATHWMPLPEPPALPALEGK